MAVLGYHAPLRYVPRSGESPALAGLSVVERTGIEPVTSGLQILSGVRRRWPSIVSAGW